MEELRLEINRILKSVLINEEFPPMPVAAPTPAPEAPAPVVAQPSAIPQPKNVNPKTIRFNKGLENEYQVTFSERGFLLDNTRLSFDEIKNALSKSYTLTLQGGTVLDAVKMQQILRYENQF